MKLEMVSKFMIVKDAKNDYIQNQKCEHGRNS